MKKQEIQTQKKYLDVDLAIINAVIYTMDYDGEKKIKTAQAMGIKNGKIVFVGTKEELETIITEKTKIFDAQKNTIIPGLIDSHAHLIGLGKSLSIIDLRGIHSYQQLIRTVQDAVMNTAPGEWILGRGWDQNLWIDKQFPHHQDLSRIAPNNPVWLVRIDGHAGLANELTMMFANINEKTKEPAGGKIVYDDDKKLSGVFIDNAMELITSIIPSETETTLKQYFLKAQNTCLSQGITMVHDMGINPQVSQLYHSLFTSNEMKMRVYGFWDGEPFIKNQAVDVSPEYFQNDNPKFSMRAIKVYADGALGSRGALLFEPYADDNKNNGLMLYSQEQLNQFVSLAIEKGFQVGIHAIGDKANNMAFNAFAFGQEQNSSKRDLRMRIEHAQVLAADDLLRFNNLQVIASMQPTHATSDMPWAEQRLGAKRILGAYAWKSILETQAHIAFGSDFPIEEVNPFLGIYSAVTRMNLNQQPQEGWYSQQILSREQAVHAFTVEGAYAAFMEKHIGTLTEGKWADFIIIDKNIFTVPVKDILETKVLQTFVAGELVYQSAEQPNHPAR